MAHNQNDSGKLETTDAKSKICCCIKAVIPFVLGLGLALAFGWLVFPNLLYTKNEQPIEFNHQIHLAKADMSCTDCHTLRDDGSFSGFPSIEVCATCHSEPIGESEKEKNFITEYVQNGVEVPWLAYQKQPDNVYFSHAAHSMESCNTCHDFTPVELCSLCHIDVVNAETLPPQYRDWITGYSKDTMTMDACERCHAHPEHLGPTDANNACFVCHK